MKSLLAIWAAGLFGIFGSLITDVRAERRFTKNIRFVIDVSGSMTGDRVGRALDSFISISEQPVDEMQIACITFDHDFAVWPGVPEPDPCRPVPPQWAAMPNPDAIADVKAFIQQRIRGGNTCPTQAIHAAFADNRKDLTIVLVTDGEFPANTVECLEQLQAARTDNKLEEAVIVAWNVGPENTIMKDIAKRWGGGCYRQTSDHNVNTETPTTPPVVTGPH